MAYLTFDPITLQPTGVQWRSTDEPAVEISQEESLEFISGSRVLIDYHVVLATDGPKLARKEIPVPSTVFWTLVPLSSMTGVVISLAKNSISVKSSIPLVPPVMLFATLKDDPTWLVSCWDLSSISPDSSGRRRIAFDGAKNHDYYMSKAHENQNG